jgi:hypothetical protein
LSKRTLIRSPDRSARRWIAVLSLGLWASCSPARADDPATDAHAPATAGPSPAPVLVVSGQLRERASYQSAIEYDAAAETAGWFWTQRARITADARANDHLRARVSLVSALIEGGDDTSPIERNVLDLQEAFVEVGPEDAFLRLGRQEIRLGSQRLVAVRDGTTVRRTWDGARLAVRRGAVELDAFALRLVAVETNGILNDGRDEGRDLAGVQVALPAPIGRIEAYYLYAEHDARRTIEGTADERRHSLGLRAAGQRRGWFWDWEAVYQTGRFGRGAIAAWTLATNTGYRWEDRPLRPEVMLSANIASGDGEAGDGRLGTFNALYPNASYFSENAVLGPANFVNFHPYLRLHPAPALRLSADVNAYWRASRADGVYGPPGNLIRAPAGARARLVDVSISGGAEWQASKHLLVSLLFTHSAPQAFIRATGPADPIDFVEMTLQLDF